MSLYVNLVGFFSHLSVRYSLIEHKPLLNLFPEAKYFSQLTLSYFYLICLLTFSFISFGSLHYIYFFNMHVYFLKADCLEWIYCVFILLMIIIQKFMFE